MPPLGYDSFCGHIPCGAMPRRQALMALSGMTMIGLLPWQTALAQYYQGQDRPRDQVLSVRGHATINGIPAHMGMTIGVDSVIQTGLGAEIIYTIGFEVIKLYERTRMTHGGNLRKWGEVYGRAMIAMRAVMDSRLFIPTPHSPANKATETQPNVSPHNAPPPAAMLPNLVPYTLSVHTPSSLISMEEGVIYIDTAMGMREDEFSQEAHQVYGKVITVSEYVCLCYGKATLHAREIEVKAVKLKTLHHDTPYMVRSNYRQGVQNKIGASLLIPSREVVGHGDDEIVTLMSALRGL